MEAELGEIVTMEVEVEGEGEGEGEEGAEPGGPTTEVGASCVSQPTINTTIAPMTTTKDNIPMFFILSIFPVDLFPGNSQPLFLKAGGSHTRPA